MTSVALLPTPGDPFVARYWTRNYERVWKGEVDELIVLVNGREPEEAAAIYRSVGANVVTAPQRMGHGEALRALVNMADADVVMLAEDDAFVREPGAVREAVELAQAGTITASPRGGMHPRLEEAALAKWGPVQGPDGSTGHGLWPCFLFARLDQLRQTSLEFQSRFWGQGETVPGLGYRIGSDALDTDTMTAVAFQLRERFPIRLAGQWKETHQKTFPGQAPWFHAGGFSTFDEMPRQNCGGTNEGRDWAHRCWWWDRTASVDFPINPPGIRERWARIKHIVEVGNLAPDLYAWGDIIPPWINWDERP